MAQANLKFLQSEKFVIDPSSSSAEDDWKFWFKTFSNFINELPGGKSAIKKLDVLTAHLTVPLYKLVLQKTTYERVIERLQKLFVKPRNFFFFYLYIYPPNSQESDGGAIHRVSKYPDLLPEMPRYCCPLVI